MSEQADLPTETRWRCQKCSVDVADERQHVLFVNSGALGFIAGGAYDILVPYRAKLFEPTPTDTITERWVPFSGPPERGHMIYWSTGGRAGVYGGWTRHSNVCGPLRLVEIDAQEIFL